MNCKKLTIIILPLISLFLPIPFQTFAQSKEANWNYPIRPGTEEWEKLNSFSERLNAFNIPDSILNNMTTENLVKTCLAYPWWMLITSRDDNQAGYDFLKKNFNGFQELETRKDAGFELVKIYGSMLPAKIVESKTLISKGRFSYQFIFIEILLSQTSTIENLTKQNLIQLLESAIFVFQNKTNPELEYSLLSLSSTGLILVRILERNNSKEFIIFKNEFLTYEQFNKTGITSNRELLLRLNSLAIEHLKTLKL